jgi:hypothetical protein
MPFFQKLLNKKEPVQTVPIDEYNKAKQALEEANNRIISLTKANHDIINQTELVVAETEYLQYQTRKEKIVNILSRLNITDKERRKLLETLLKSDLSIEFIEETYSPIMTKKNIQIGTKLPQKSIPDKEFSYYT